MQKPKAIRKIDGLGRIVLPVEVRVVMDWHKGSAVDVWINEEAREVTLTTHTYACTHCGTTENLKEFNSRFICSDCQSAIAKL